MGIYCRKSAVLAYQKIYFGISREINLICVTNTNSTIMKQILTLGLVLLAFIAQAGKTDLPFGLKKMNPKVEKLIKDTRLYRSDAQFRVAASGFPDSMLTYGWDGAAWGLEDRARIRYTNFGKISSIIFYSDLGGASVPDFFYEYTYDAAGRTTRIEIVETLPGTPPAVAERITMNYDAQGNQTSMLIFEEDNGTLVLSSGDSLQINYAGGVPSQATRYTWDNFAPVPAWVAAFRFTNFSYDANGLPTAVTFSFFDGFAFIEVVRYVDMAWKMGYADFSGVFGGLIDVSDFLFQELPTDTYFGYGPTDYTAEVKEGVNWVLDERSQSTGAVGAVSQIRYQNRAMGAWVDYYRQTLTYTAGRVTLILEEDTTGTGWEQNARNSWTYDTQGNLTEVKQEYYDIGTWTTDFAERNIFNYTADNKVFRWVGERWDSGINGYVNDTKREYFFGSFALSVATNKFAQVQVYPNPVQDVMNVTLESVVAGKLSAQIFNLQGQLVASEAFNLTAGNNQFQLQVQNLAKGLYQLRLQTTSGLETVRFVK